MADVQARSSSAAQQRPLRVLPVHLLVLLATVAVALWLVVRAARAPTEVEHLAFAAIFNTIVGAGLALAWLLDAVVVVAGGRGRRQPLRRLVRLVSVSVPAAGFLVGHWLLNPWAEQLAREAWRAVR